MRLSGQKNDRDRILAITDIVDFPAPTALWSQTALADFNAAFTQQPGRGSFEGVSTVEALNVVVTRRRVTASAWTMVSSSSPCSLRVLCST